MPGNFLDRMTGVQFEAALPELVKGQRWFGGKARTVERVQIADRIPILTGSSDTMLVLIDVVYQDGGQETYALPLASAFGEEASQIRRDMPRAVFSRFAADETNGFQEGILYDGTVSVAAMHALVRAMQHGTTFAGEAGSLQASSTPAYEHMLPPGDDPSLRMLSAEQSNTSVAFGDYAVLKLYRRLYSGLNPDWEIGRYLTSRAFPYSPAVGGALQYVRSGETATVGLLQAFVRNQCDAWSATLTQLDGFLARLAGQSAGVDSGEGRGCGLWDLAQMEPSRAGATLIGAALDAAASLARRTAALHLTLGEVTQDPDFVPESLTLDYRQTRCQSMVESWKRVVQLLNRRSVTATSLEEEDDRLLAHESNVLGVFRSLLDIAEGGQRIRCHGDYHLGQVLWTGTDYIVTDFEGEPARPLAERRLKHSPLYDVAGMLRSFDYAAWTALGKHESTAARQEFEPWTRYWSRWVRARFLHEYVRQLEHAPFWPPSSKDAARLLTIYQLEKAVYELGYELNNRPQWVGIPLKGINEIVRMSGAQAAA
ncbi:MAG TPA: putative maltokinase [Nitrospira sp.]|nr:putative maltokinase [Nitrospira sp.]